MLGGSAAGTTVNRHLLCHLMVRSTIKLVGIFSEIAVAWRLAAHQSAVVSDCLCIIWGAFSFFPVHSLITLHFEA